MIFGKDKKELQKAYDEKYKEYANLINTPSASDEEKCAVKSELRYIERQLDQLKGSNEKQREDELNSKKQRRYERIVQNYDAFKSKYKPISNFNIAINHLTKAIEYSKKPRIENINEKDKIMMKAM